MSTYATLDAEILRGIRAGKHPLYFGPATAEARRIAHASGRDEMRVVDGRVQALRRAGTINVDRKVPAGWAVKEESSKQGME